MSKSTHKYRQSLFRRMTVFYCTLSLFVIAGLTLAWIMSNTAWLSRQMMSYDMQIMNALENTIEKQHTLLKQTQYHIYTYQASDQTPMYKLMRDYIRMNDLETDDDLLEYQDARRRINQYITMIEQPRTNDMAAFMITGRNFSENDIFQLNMLDGMIISNARTVAEQIYCSSAVPSRRSTRIVPSFILGSTRVYALYDELREYDMPQDFYGYLINVYSVDTLNDLIGSFSEPPTGDMYVLDSLGSVMYSSSGEGYDAVFADFDMALLNPNGSFTDGDTIYTVHFNDMFGFYTIDVFDQSAVYSRGRSNMISVLLIALLAVIIAVLCTQLSLRQTMHRMELLLDGIKRARTNIRVRLPLTGPEDELYIITDETNKMLSRIEAHIHHSLEQEIENKNIMLQQREAELYALQTQINPHSLYNTLEIIRMKALANGDEDCAMMIKALAQSFRERVKGSAVILLRQELNTLRQLGDIYSMRYDSLLTVNEDISADALDCAVLRDTLTPVIENVFIHAIPEGCDPEEFQITVSAIRSGGMLVMRVTDSGRGISEKQLDELRQKLVNPSPESSGHVGLENIQSRIAMTFGGEYGITISSREGSGCSVEIRIPAMSLEALSELATLRMPDYRVNETTR